MPKISSKETIVINEKIEALFQELEIYMNKQKVDPKCVYGYSNSSFTEPKNCIYLQNKKRMH